MCISDAGIYGMCLHWCFHHHGESLSEDRVINLKWVTLLLSFVAHFIKWRCRQVLQFLSLDCLLSWINLISLSISACYTYSTFFDCWLHKLFYTILYNVHSKARVTGHKDVLDPNFGKYITSSVLSVVLFMSVTLHQYLFLAAFL